MTKTQIKAAAPKDATHYTIIMFLGLVYLKYVDNEYYWFDESIKSWVKTKAFTEGTKL